MKAALGQCGGESIQFRPEVSASTLDERAPCVGKEGEGWARLGIGGCLKSAVWCMDTTRPANSSEVARRHGD